MTQESDSCPGAAPESHAPRSFAKDVLGGLGLFVLVALLTASDASQAAGRLIGELGLTVGLIAETSVASPGVVVLALAFSVLFALNAAFFRHLRRSYAPVRSRR